MIEFIKGNIFTTKCQVIVNTINCVGVMGAGIALECRFRHPEMYARYVNLCKENKIDIGKLWLYKSSDPWILNFPTKKDWKRPSSIQYIKSGLEKFRNSYHSKGVYSIAFPLLGADKGGIDEEVSISLMTEYLSDLDLKIEIYRYDPNSTDDLYNTLKDWMLSNDIEYVTAITGIKRQYITKIKDSLSRDDICQLNQLAKIKGIGITSLERLFKFSTTGIMLNHQEQLF